MIFLEKAFQGYLIFYIASFYTYLIRVYFKYSELPIAGKNQEFPIHGSLVDVLFSIIGIICVSLLVIVLVQLKKGKTIFESKLSVILILYMILHVVINPFFFWYID